VIDPHAPHADDSCVEFEKLRRLFARNRSGTATGRACRKRQLASRLADERGIALVIALGTMLALAVSATTAISFAMASSRHASSFSADQKAYALAEAGLNSALAVLAANYPGTVAYPGDANLLSARTTTYGEGTATWSGSLLPVTNSPWTWQWKISSVGTVKNPTGPGAADATRSVSAVVPVTIPENKQTSGKGVLNWIYAGTDITFSQSVQIGSPVYAVRDLTLLSSSKIAGVAARLAVGRNLALTSNQNRVGLLSGSDPRLGEAHVVGLCSSKGNAVLHQCGGSATATSWDTDDVYATAADHSLVGLLDATPSLTCCAPAGGVIAPIASPVSDMGFWYKNADLGPTVACDASTRSGTPPTFDTGDNTINNTATLSVPFNLTPATGSYTCQSFYDAAHTSLRGELSWNATTKVLKIKGTIFIDGSATIDSSGYSGTPVFKYTGQATVVLSGTFAVKSAKICAVISGSDCDRTSGAWNPNNDALVIVADGDGVNGGVQSQSNVVESGVGIALVTGASFQGALIANKTIKTEQTATQHGPMISVYNQVLSGQTGNNTFPAVEFAPAAAGQIASGTLPLGQLSGPRYFAG
jgi:Tfp pilus assembly protein PilX